MPRPCSSGRDSELADARHELAQSLLGRVIAPGPVAEHHATVEEDTVQAAAPENGEGRLQAHRSRSAAVEPHHLTTHSTVEFLDGRWCLRHDVFRTRSGRERPRGLIVGRRRPRDQPGGRRGQMTLRRNGRPRSDRAGAERGVRLAGLVTALLCAAFAGSLGAAATAAAEPGEVVVARLLAAGGRRRGCVRGACREPNGRGGGGGFHRLSPGLHDGCAGASLRRVAATFGGAASGRGRAGGRRGRGGRP